MGLPEGSQVRDQEVSLDERAWRIRRHVMDMARQARGGYLAQGLGAADLMAGLFFHALRLDPARPDWDDRDRFLLSCSHYGIVVYGALIERGVLSRDLIPTYSRNGSVLEMIASEKVPTVENTGGSLAQALSIAIGMALRARRNERRHGIYIFMSDGELQEGQTWEAAMAGAHLGLDNVTAFMDINDQQVDGAIPSVMTVNPIEEKWKAFGWHTLSIDGNDLGAITAAFDAARAEADRPSVILARTRLGQGCRAVQGPRAKHYIRLSPEEWDELELESVGFDNE